MIFWHFLNQIIFLLEIKTKFDEYFVLKWEERQF